MKLLRDDERPVEIHNNSPTEVEFALLFAPKVKDKDLKSKIAQESKWQTVPGELTHRRLINDQAYSRFADLVLNYGNGELPSAHDLAIKTRLAVNSKGPFSGPWKSSRKSGQMGKCPRGSTQL